MKTTLLVLFTISLSCAQEDTNTTETVSTEPTFTSSEVTNCFSCWGKFSEDAYYCRTTDGVGYCCDPNSSDSFCEESATSECSFDLAYSMNRYGYCLEPAPAICGDTTDFALSTTSETVSISQLTKGSINGSVC